MQENIIARGFSTLLSILLYNNHLYISLSNQNIEHSQLVILLPCCRGLQMVVTGHCNELDTLPLPYCMLLAIVLTCKCTYIYAHFDNMSHHWSTVHHQFHLVGRKFPQSHWDWTRQSIQCYNWNWSHWNKEARWSRLVESVSLVVRTEATGKMEVGLTRFCLGGRWEWVLQLSHIQHHMLWSSYCWWSVH